MPRRFAFALALTMLLPAATFAGDRPDKGHPRLGHKVHRLFQSCTGDCGEDHNHVGCTGCRSEYLFIFGSCRDFFSERKCESPAYPRQRFFWRHSDPHH